MPKGMKHMPMKKKEHMMPGMPPKGMKPKPKPAGKGKGKK